MQDAKLDVSWTAENAHDGYITFRRFNGAVTRVKVFCPSGAYEDWQFAQDVAQAIYWLPQLLHACDMARRKMSDEDRRETEIDGAFDSAMNWYARSEGSCGVDESSAYPQALPRVRFFDKEYFVDARLQELRNVSNPHDRLAFQPVEYSDW